MRRALFMAVLLLAGALAPTAAADWQAAGPGYTWSFPRDHHLHPGYKTEWWYVTGHLFPVDPSWGPPLAFQQTFFRLGLAPDQADTTGSAWATHDLVMAHASVADPGRDRHFFAEVLRRAVPMLGGFGAPGDSTLAWCRAPAGTPGAWSIVRDDEGAFRLRARDDSQGLRYNLVARPARPLVFHGEGGFSPKKAAGSAGSLYFSATRLEVTGQVWRDGNPVVVSGQAWLDREIFTSTLDDSQQGWDWLSLQLEDGRDLMVYRLRGTDGSGDFALGTLVEADGRTRSLPATSWTWQPGETWTSPATGAVYPVTWRLRVPDAGVDLELRATMAAQENVSTRAGLHYWEGAVEAFAAGAPVGRGFVELTGYGKGNRPPVGR